MTHTPGPWTQHGKGISKDSHECQYAIASCDSPVPAEEAEANARLIAAAPDLLAALKALQLTAFDAAVNSIPEAHITLRQELGHLCKQARAAIAKATNEEA